MGTFTLEPNHAKEKKRGLCKYMCHVNLGKSFALQVSVPWHEKNKNNNFLPRLSVFSKILYVKVFCSP